MHVWYLINFSVARLVPATIRWEWKSLGDIYFVLDMVPMVEEEYMLV